MIKKESRVYNKKVALEQTTLYKLEQT